MECNRCLEHEGTPFHESCRVSRFLSGCLEPDDDYNVVATTLHVCHELSRVKTMAELRQDTQIQLAGLLSDIATMTAPMNRSAMADHYLVLLALP